MTATLVLRRLCFLLFALACLAIALHAFGYLFQEVNLRNPFHVSFSNAGWTVPAHFFASGLALLLMPLQFAQRVRVRWPALHRTSGWLYVLSVLLGGVSGLLLAARAQGGWVTGASFLLLALLWLGVTAMAVYWALRGRVQAHRRWMLRSAALTFAAPMLRVYLGVGVGLFELRFEQAYILAAWLCWTLNLLLMELYLRWPRMPSGRGCDIGSVSRRAGA